MQIRMAIDDDPLLSDNALAAALSMYNEACPRKVSVPRFEFTQISNALANPTMPATFSVPCTTLAFLRAAAEQRLK